MPSQRKMQHRDLVLAVIAQCSPQAEFGRTSLQKVTYLASIVLGEQLGHRAYYYGPYSAQVEADAEALVLSGLVTETATSLGYNPKGFPVNRYRYELTASGDERTKKVYAAYAEETKSLTSFVNSIRTVVGSFDQKTLSAAAKTLYIAREQSKAVTADEVRRLGTDYGWNLTTSSVEKVTRILTDLNLVKVVKS